MPVINFKNEKKKELFKEIQGFFLDDHDKEIRILAAEAILGFFDEKLGVSYYNKALDDSKNGSATAWKTWIMITNFSINNSERLIHSQG